MEPSSSAMQLFDLPAAVLERIWALLEAGDYQDMRYSYTQREFRACCRFAWAFFAPLIRDLSIQLPPVRASEPCPCAVQRQQQRAMQAACSLRRLHLGPMLPGTRRDLGVGLGEASDGSAPAHQFLTLNAPTVRGVTEVWMTSQAVDAALMCHLLSALPHLSKLEVEGTPEDCISSDALRCLGLTSTLHTLIIDGLSLKHPDPHVGDQLSISAALAPLSSATSLTDLELRLGQPQWWQLHEVLPTLAHLTGLTRLHLAQWSEDQIFDEDEFVAVDLSEFSLLQPLTRLSDLTYRGLNEQAGAPAAQMQALIGLTQLRRVHLLDIYLQDGAVLALLLHAATRMESLELELPFSGFIDWSDMGDAAALPPGGHPHTLQHLTCNVVPACMLASGVLLGVTRLEVRDPQRDLSLRVAADAGEARAQAARLHTLARSLLHVEQVCKAHRPEEAGQLALKWNRARSCRRHTPLLEALSPLGPTLRRLALTRCGLNRKAAHALAAALPRLEALRLTACVWHDDDVLSLLAQRLEHLTHLMLDPTDPDAPALPPPPPPPPPPAVPAPAGQDDAAAAPEPPPHMPAHGAAASLLQQATVVYLTAPRPLKLEIIGVSREQLLACEATAQAAQQGDRRSLVVFVLPPGPKASSGT